MSIKLVSIFLLSLFSAGLFSVSNVTSIDESTTVSLNTVASLSDYENATIHYGDLTIDGTETFVIENCNWTQIGNVHVRDHGTLIIRNSYFLFSQTNMWQYLVNVTNSAKVVLENVELVNLHRYHMYGFDTATVVMTNVSSKGLQTDGGSEGFEALYFAASGNTFVEVKNSTISYAMSFRHNSQGSIENSRIERLFFGENAVGYIKGVSVTIVLEAYHESHISIMESNISILLFGIHESTIQIDSLEPGFFSQWNSYEEHMVVSGTPNITLSEVVVDNWGLYVYSSEARVRRSVLYYLVSFYDSVTSVQDSIIGQLGSQTYEEYSTTEVRDSEVRALSFAYFNGSFYFDNVTGLAEVWYVSYSDFYMSGNFSFLASASIWDWSDSSCIRNFNVVCADVSGRPTEGVTLALSDKFGTTVWTTTSDNYGNAGFNLTFTDSNYADTLELKATLGSWSATKTIALLSDTPVNLQTPMPTDLNMDGTVNILDITVVAAAYNTRPGDEKWNATADLDKNEWINILDISAVARDFGKTV